MTRLILITLLVLLCSGPVSAEWVELGSSQGRGGYTLYADPDTIRRKGELVKMWGMSDFKTTQQTAGFSYLAMKQQWEFDCAEERHRTLAMIEFSGNMESGNVVYSDSVEGKWIPISPRSVGLSLWKVACDKP
jgi:hypothetical protein